ncbi:hypothetical protein [Paenibacillus glycanilyticus]|uniref:Uncharacterized protein n=1 Tax=Paenibacillus glycanilyticus TaxID=126569 RepID=A0ABQ6GHX9_9BACL|nr:hypothetical protein [Paenibacillus glycanilyticus]GLX70317.1 hypothetical protein MU1_46630 [Paenibacillus glycanilyticus]
MKKYLVISQIIYLLFLIPWLFTFGMSFFAFDNGFSAWNILFVIGIAVYPLFMITSSIVAWTLHRRHKQAAIITNCVPMLWVGSIGTLLLYATLS